MGEGRKKASEGHTEEYRLKILGVPLLCSSVSLCEQFFGLVSSTDQQFM
jgi:hypothetical protein